MVSRRSFLAHLPAPLAPALASPPPEPRPLVDEGPLMAAFNAHVRAVWRVVELGARSDTLYRAWRRGAVAEDAYRTEDAALMADQFRAARQANAREDGLVAAIHALGPNARGAAVAGLLVVVADDRIASRNRDAYEPWNGRLLVFDLAGGEVAGVGRDAAVGDAEPARPAAERCGGVHDPAQARARRMLLNDEHRGQLSPAEANAAMDLAIRPRAAEPR